MSPKARAPRFSESKHELDATAVRARVAIFDTLSRNLHISIVLPKLPQPIRAPNRNIPPLLRIDPLRHQLHAHELLRVRQTVCG
jgi:hypothetical protein